MNDRNLCYHCLVHPVFLDIMFVSAVSRKGNRYTQVYATDFGWASALPMASRSEAHETLLLLFARDVFSPACVCDNAKEMVQGKFHQKLKDAACYLKQLGSYSPWSNAGCKLLRSRASKHLWDNCLELEAYIRSKTAHEIYQLDGK